MKQRISTEPTSLIFVSEAFAINIINLTTLVLLHVPISQLGMSRHSKWLKVISISKLIFYDSELMDLYSLLGTIWSLWPFWLFAGLVYFFVYAFIPPLRYYSKHEIPFNKPMPMFGSLWGVIFQSESFYDFLLNSYTQFKGHR